MANQSRGMGKTVPLTLNSKEKNNDTRNNKNNTDTFS